jgi:hypothetical protein
LEVGCDDSKQTKAKLTKLIGRKPDAPLMTSVEYSRKSRMGHVWNLPTLADVERAREAVRAGFDRDTPPRLYDPTPWARASVYDATGAALLDRVPAPPTAAFRVELVTGVVACGLEMYLTDAVGHTPESVPGRFSWSFTTVDEARRAEDALAIALTRLPSVWRAVARGSVVRVQAMKLTELPARSQCA